MRERPVPRALVDAWELALHHPDPLIALSAARVVRAHLASWESELAAEAALLGATWETIGDAIGVSRQAAWERFHDAVPDDSPALSGGRRRYESEVARLRNEVARLKRSARR